MSIGEMIRLVFLTIDKVRKGCYSHNNCYSQYDYGVSNGN